MMVRFSFPGELPLGSALGYCTLASSTFVGSLYAVVPRRIRALDRDHAEQIQWRSLSTSLACAVSIGALPWLYGGMTVEHVKVSDWIRQEMRATSRVLLHTALLYLGPLLESVLRIHHGSLMAMLPSYYNAYVKPTMDVVLRPRSSSERWMVLRNLLIAPLMEEILFRGCLVTVLSSTKLSQTSIIWIAPCFFGTAHLHHAFLKLRSCVPPRLVALSTAVQFAYTSLFGAYTTYVYLRTRSILAITASHAFCNAMGLPRLDFVQHNSSVYQHCWLVGAAHLLGLGGFVWTLG